MSFNLHSPDVIHLYPHYFDISTLQGGGWGNHEEFFSGSVFRNAVCSVADPFHFDTDPDPRIYQKYNVPKDLVLLFLSLLFRFAKQKCIFFIYIIFL